MTIITGIIADSAGVPANGRIEFEQMLRFGEGDMQVTGTAAVAQVVRGRLQTLTGEPFTLPASPDGTAVRIREILGGRTYEWLARVPAAEAVEYHSLVQVFPDKVTEFAPPPWMASVMQARDETFEAKDATRETIDQAQVLVDSLGGLAGITAEADRAETAAGSATAEAGRAELAAASIDIDGINTRFEQVDTALGVKASVEYVDQQVAASSYAGDPITLAAEFSALERVAAPVGQRLTVPTHLSPAGGQVTHPSVVFFPEPWNGYQYWMAITPYPSGNDAHEDPNIVASTDGVKWVVPAGLVNPLDDAPGSPKYNSDTDLVYAQGRLWCFWRYLDTGAGAASENIYVRSSQDGVTWTPKQLVYRANMTTRRLVSPTFAFEAGRWTMWAVDIVTSPFKLVRLQTTAGSPFAGQWGTPTVCSLTVPSGRDPWHVEVRRFGDKYLALLADCIAGQSGASSNLYLLSSVDGITWKRSGTVLVPQTQAGEHNALYRASFVPEFIDGRLGLRIWYAGWMTGPPSVWNLYRTLATVITEQAGTASFTGSIAAGGVRTGTVTFPMPFASPPFVVMVTDSGRLNVAVTTITETGFDYVLNNWTAAAAGSAAGATNIRWIARL